MDIKQYLEELNLSNGADTEPIPSETSFEDGAQYRIEVLPEAADEYTQLFEACDDVGLIVNRVTDTSGSVFTTDNQIRTQCDLCREQGAELLLAPGQGLQNSTSHQKALNAMPSGTVRGMDEVINSVDEMMRCVELGCRGFILFDVGMYYLCDKMREDGILPPNTTVKLSSQLALANPAAFQFWSRRLQPEDSINPVRDLSVSTLAAIRSVTSAPMDVHIYWKGKLTRLFEVPEIARACAPVYFKNYLPNVPVEKRVLQSRRIVDQIQMHQPDIEQSQPGNGLGIPVET